MEKPEIYINLKQNAKHTKGNEKKKKRLMRNPIIYYKMENEQFNQLREHKLKFDSFSQQNNKTHEVKRKRGMDRN